MKKVGVAILIVCTMLSLLASPIFADTVVNSTRTVSFDKTIYTDPDYGSVHAYVTVTSLRPYLRSYDIDNYSDYKEVIEIGQTYLYMIRLYNTTSHTVVLNRGFVGIIAQRPDLSVNNLTNKGYGNDITIVGGDLLDSFSIGTNGQVNGYVSSNYSYQNMITLPPKSSIYSFVNVASYESYSGDIVQYTLSDFDRPVSSVAIPYPESGTVNDNAYLYNADYNSYLSLNELQNIYSQLVLNTQAINDLQSQTVTNVNAEITWLKGMLDRQDTTNSHLSSINSNVQTITDAYTSNASNISSTTEQIADTQSTIDNVHQNEMSWYQAQESAINEVGLSNSSLSQNQYQGVTPVASDLSRLWTSIGPVKYITLFALMASLSSFMLRHRPFTKIAGKIDKNSS